ncbi:MAG: protein-glutamate O-methyltransferase CheR [Firmicutes bacterium]|nr:protein-glutamate O-methyltransferase CheR [Bacillota bacterium]
MDEWDRVLEALRRAGLDLSAYKEPQLERRLESFLQRESFPSLAPFLEALDTNRDLFRRFYSYLTIHVTEFFRDVPYWAAFRSALEAQGRRHVSLWSAGCSWGAEPVTAAVILEDLGLSYDILATDTDELMLDAARTGRFSRAELEKVPPPYRRHFRVVGAEAVEAVLERGRIAFRRHDLVAEPPPGQFDVVICRNLIIYFRPPARAVALERLAQAVKPGGFLFLGATETFLEAQHWGFQVAAPALFYKKSAETSEQSQTPRVESW